MRPTYEDPYTLEYKALYSNLRGETPIKTTAADGMSLLVSGLVCMVANII